MSYSRVDSNSLKEGMLLDRPLCVHLPKNDRYVTVAREYRPLERRELEKLQKYGEVFSPNKPLEERYPNFEATVATLIKVCDNDELAPFEKGLKIRKAFAWLSNLVFPNHLSDAGNPDLDPGIFLIARAFGVPAAETITFLSDLSVTVYENSLKTAATAGIIALWLDYCDAAFIRRFVTSVFCAEVGALNDATSASLIDAITGKDTTLSESERSLFKSRRRGSVQLMRAGKIPGAEAPDHRLSALIDGSTWQGWNCDELMAIAELARWLVCLPEQGQNARLPLENRAFQKLVVALDLKFSESGRRIAA